MIQAKTWMNLKMIILSKRSQLKKEIYMKRIYIKFQEIQKSN